MAHIPREELAQLSACAAHTNKERPAADCCWVTLRI